MSLEVLRPGPLALVEDAGRPGYAAVGVSRSGAADRTAFVAGALLVGNDPQRHAALEITLGGLSLRAREPVTLALTGAVCPARADERTVAWAEPFTLTEGATLTLGLPRAGLRSYLSVAGGIDVQPVLGSRSADVLSGLGPPRLLPGTLLAVSGPAHRLHVAATLPPAEGPQATTAPEDGQAPATPVVELLPGPRTDWLADPDALATTWTVSPESNRVGVRLEGTALRRKPSREGAELPSEPLVRGAVQLPPSGQPLVFGPDHPTTGGYPVVAVLTEAASDRLAQCRPGDRIRLAWSDQPGS